MDDNNKYIRFDWAMKRMLRDKANFAVLEGLMTVLLDGPVRIVQILESEGNQETADDKYNRVDIKAENSKGEIIIVEIQLTRELYYLHRILYGVSKAITEHIHLGDRYDQVKKVYSISVVYFDIGEGADYLYHGTTRFIGVHTHDSLKISQRGREALNLEAPEDMFPEYYIIRVNEFDKIAKTPLEEWLDYIKNGHIREDTTTPGLQEAKERLQVMNMTKTEREAYFRHLDNIMVQNDVLDTAKRDGYTEGREDGRVEGIQQGIKQGIKQERLKAAKTMRELGMDIVSIEKVTGLSRDEIASL